MSNILVRLSEIIDEISMGPFGSDIKVENFVKVGIPVLNGSNLTGFKLVENGFKYVTDEKARTFKKAIAKKGDIVITHRGTLGQISFIPDNSKHDWYVISQSQFRVRLKNDKADPSYVVYYFHTPEGQKRLLSFKNHVGVPALAQATTNFRKLEIPLPDLPTQKKIASFLSLLDSKIELNNNINAELEAMTKMLYDYWFVQFDFPNGKGKPYKSSGGKLEWNEELKSEIPIGWDVNNLKDITSLFARGISPKYCEDGGICVLNQKCIRNKSIKFELGKRHDYSSKKSESKLIEVGDVLVNSTGVGTLGRLALVKRLEEPQTTADSHITIVRIDQNKANRLFAAYSLTQKQTEIEQLGEGSTGQIELSRDNLGKLKLVLPPMQLQKTFESKLNPIIQKISNNEIQNRQLSNLRDWLLPLLMNGQAKISIDKFNEQLQTLSNTQQKALSI